MANGKAEFHEMGPIYRKKNKQAGNICARSIYFEEFCVSKMQCLVVTVIPILSMYGIFTYIWLIFMVNVGKYTVTYHTWILWDMMTPANDSDLTK